jgi:hypothetical protein
MSTKNELVALIDSARTRSIGVKSIRRQKYDPNNSYMSLTDGKQVGPIKVEGNIDQLDRKFAEAQSYLNDMKMSPPAQRATAA